MGQKKCGPYFVTSLKHLIVSDTGVSYSNFLPLVFLFYFFTGSGLTSLIINTLFYQMPVCTRVLFWVPCCSWYILIISSPAYCVISDCLLVRQMSILLLKPLNLDLDGIRNWSSSRLVSFNPAKTWTVTYSNYGWHRRSSIPRRGFEAKLKPYWTNYSFLRQTMFPHSPCALMVKTIISGNND